MLSVIGKGSYAKVVLVKKKDNGKLFALKSMKKKYIEKKKQEGRVVVEKEILAKIKHPFLVTMASAFQSDQKLFLVL
jgi:serum/glucocorticoid-regulated kinase 2